MVKVRFAPSPTGSLHLGNALIAVANRGFADKHGGRLLLRIDDTDPTRVEPGGEEAILADLEWMGVRWDEGPVRQSERADRYREAVGRLGDAAVREDGAIRFRGRGRQTLLRADGSATYHLASVVDDVELGVTHVVRGKDLQPSTPLHVALAEALGARPPEYVHVGLLLGPDGKKLSKRHGASTLAELREAGIPGSAARAYLEELGLPRGDVQLDPARVRRLAIEAIAAMPDEELAAAADAPPALAPALRGSRDLEEARAAARAILAPEPVSLPPQSEPTLERFRELVERAKGGGLDEEGARAILRELKAVGGDLRAVRLALTGRERGPELWAVLAALPREETLRRIDAAL